MYCKHSLGPVRRSSRVLLVIMEWPSHLIISLLEKVRIQELLWDVRSPLYAKKTLKRAKWEEICRELKVEYPEATALLTTGEDYLLRIINESVQGMAGQVN